MYVMGGFSAFIFITVLDLKLKDEDEDVACW